MRTLHVPLATALCTALALPAPAFASATASASISLHARSGPEEMSEEEKMAKAKELWTEGDAAFKAGDFSTALARFEEAYNVYAPNLHLFNVNVGLAAYELGDCIKAKKAFERFLDLVPEHPARAEAQEKLLEIERSKCAETQQPTEQAPITQQPTGPVTQDVEEAPVLTSRSDEREAAADQERAKRDAAKRPLFIGGIALTAVGGLMAIGGGVALGLANKEANDLAGLASPGPTGFPDGNYADDEVFESDRNTLPALNTTGAVLLGIGAPVLIGGISMIVIDVVRRKRNVGPVEEQPTASRGKKVELVGVSPTMLRQGGGASATVRF